MRVLVMECLNPNEMLETCALCAMVPTRGVRL